MVGAGTVPIGIVDSPDGDNFEVILIAFCGHSGGNITGTISSLLVIALRTVDPTADSMISILHTMRWEMLGNR